MTLRKHTTFAVAGECMATRPLSVFDEPAYLEVIERIRTADIAYAHVETNFGHFSEVEAPARSESLGTYFLSDPAVASDLRWAGVDLVSLANNHSFDFGTPGIMSTMRHSDQAGLVHAGTGRDLEEAREPAYLETKHGRVALISTASGNRSHEWATLPKATLPGRAGINPLRATMEWVVDHDAAQQIRDIWTRLGVLDGKPTGGLDRPTDGGVFKLPMPSDPWGANFFRESDHFEITSRCDEHDLAGNLRSVAEGVGMADLVVVAHHFSASEGVRGETPPTFVREFAHAAIDEGADVFIGHGWHKTLGIEIYKGKPIVYGIGNFVAQSEFVRRVPFDGYESWGHDIDRLTTLTPNSRPLHPGRLAHSDTWWSSALLEIELEAGNEFVGIKLHPVELGREVSTRATLRRPVGGSDHPLTDGRPFAAQGEDAARILERYQVLCSDLGTSMTVEDGVGIIH